MKSSWGRWAQASLSIAKSRAGNRRWVSSNLTSVLATMHTDGRTTLLILFATTTDQSFRTTSLFAMWKQLQKKRRYRSIQHQTAHRLEPKTPARTATEGNIPCRASMGIVHKAAHPQTPNNLKAKPQSKYHTKTYNRIEKEKHKKDSQKPLLRKTPQCMQFPLEYQHPSTRSPKGKIQNPKSKRPETPKVIPSTNSNHPWLPRRGLQYTDAIAWGGLMCM